MILTPQALAAFEKDVLARYPEEACGFVVNGMYEPKANISETPGETFRISPLDYLDATQRGLEAVLHSHPYALDKPPLYPPFWPSTADMRGWMNSGIPWGICATEGEGISKVVWLDDNDREPLLGRQFIHGINDCYSLVRDWYQQERGITLMNFARGMDWWERGEDLYDQNFEAAGFTPVPIEQIAVGDVVLFQVRSPVTNHAGILTGPNEVLHHTFHRLSGKDTLSKWHRHITKVIRYTR